MFGATLLTAFGWLAATMPAQAQITSWTGATSSDWFTAGNWSAGVPTNAADTMAIIDTVTPNATVVGTAGAQADRLLVGFMGTGVLTIQSGGTVADSLGSIASFPGSTGTVTVDGTGSSWANSGGVFVGQSGSGTLVIRNGGTVTANTSNIAVAPGSTGTATVDGTGSSWTNATFIVGFAGNGTLTVRNGGTVSSDFGSIGASSTGTGSVTVDGTDSSWAAGQLLVGNGGGATLTVQNGGTVTSSSASVGNGGPTANATVDGAGSSWANSGIFVVGSAGSGALTIRNGGTVSSAMAAVIGVGGTATGTVTVDGTGSSWTIASNLSVGSASSGTGTLTIRNGGTVRNTDGTIGDSLHGSGTVTVDGTGSSWANSARLVVGNFDTGTLAIRNGGTVSNTDGEIGNFPDTTGTVTVDGAGSRWVNSGGLTVGDQGRGVLTVSNGAAVSSTGGFIGDRTGSTGTVTVDGTGSSWTNTGTLVVGDDGSGTLTIRNGGAVSNTDGAIGNSSGLTGTVTVDGTGSSWANAGTLAVGNAGTGTLTISNGGAVSNTDGAIGSSGATGTVTVDGAGSSWANTGVLSVGNAGTGTLTIRNGGTVSAAGAVIAGAAAGTLNIGAASGETSAAPGTLSTPTVALLASTDRIVFNHTAANYVFAAAISGTGAVLVEAGTTILTANNTYTGPTTVDGGRFIVNGSIASGLTTVNSAGTLGGGGTLTGTVTVDGTLSAGTSPGTLTIGTLTLNAGSTSIFELNAPGVVGGVSNDLVIVTNGLTLGGTLQAQAAAGGYYRLFSYGGTLSGSFAVTSATGTGGFVVADHQVQVGIPGQVNLAVRGVGQTLQFWDGADGIGNGTVDGGAGTWSSAGTNWTGQPGQAGINGPWEGSVAVFAGAAGGGVSVVGTQAVDTLQFSTSGYVLGGGTLALSPASGTAGTITVDSGITATIGSTIADGTAASLNKIGGGTLILTGANTYTGGTTISAGTLSVSADANLGGAGGGLTFNGGTLQNTAAITMTRAVTLNAGGGTFQTDANLEVGGDISGSGGLTKSGAATLTLSGSNTYAGPTTITAGTLLVATSTALSPLSAITVITGGALQILGGGVSAGAGSLAGDGLVVIGAGSGLAVGLNDQSTTFSGAISGSGTFEKTGAGALTLTGTSSIGGVLSVCCGTLDIRGGSFTAGATAVSGTLTLSNGGRLQTGDLRDSGTLLITGPGSITTASGDTVIGAFNQATAVISSGGRLDSQGDAFIGMGSTITVTGTGSAWTIAGGLGIGHPVGGPGTLTVADGAAVTIIAVTTIDPASTLNLGNGGLAGSIDAQRIINDGRIVANFTDALTLAVPISGAGSLTKTGAGTLILTADNSYTGGTTITAGRLQLGNGGTAGAIAGDVVDNGILAFNRSDTVTFAGAISGGGMVEKTGAGTLTLTGTNSYGGGTTISAGTLMGNAAAFGTGGIVNNAALVVDQATAGTVSNAISGSGTVEKTGAGTLTLTGTNSYGGGTTISAGTLVGNAAAFGTGGIVNNAALVVDQAIAGTLSNAISGSGIVEKTGAGALTLTGNNSYGGGTTISAGTLMGNAAAFGTGGIVNNAALVVDQAIAGTLSNAISGSGIVEKTGAGALTLTGNNTYGGGTTISAGTLQLGNGGTTGSIIGDVLNNDTLAFDRADTVTFAGIISGTGAVQHNGAGTTVLTGTSTYAGPTSVNAGRLIVNGAIASTVTVNSGGLLGGSGTVGGIAANAGGTVSPGNSPGTLNVAGNVAFAAGATYLVEIDAANNADRIVATGTAALSGGTVQVTKAGSGYVAGTRYTILTANGSVNGTFAQLVAAGTGLPLFDLALSYDPNNVYLDVVRNAVTFCGIAASRNQCAVGSGAENLSAGNAVFDAIANLPDTAGIRRAFDLLSGEIHASTASTMVEQSQVLRDTVIGRVRQSYGTTGPAAALAPEGKVMSFAGTPPGVVPDATPADAAARLFAQAPAAPPAGDAVIAAWTQGIGAWGKRSGDGNAGTLSRSLGGFLIGVDATVDRTWRVGLAAGYTRASFDVDSRASSGNSDNYHVALYGGGQLGALGLRAGASFTWHDIGTTRRVAFPGVVDRLKADYNARTTQVFGEVGYAITLERVAFEPFAGLAWVNYRSDRINESGGAAALTGRRQAFDMGFSTLGLRAAATVTAPSDTTAVILRGTLGWRHAFGDVTLEQRLAIRAGGSPFTAVGVPIARDSLIVEAGVDIDVTNYAKFGFVYSGQFASSAQDHAIKGSLTLRL